MRILVTGGAGFIGSHIVDRYLVLGHEVFVIDDLSTGKKEFLSPKAHFWEVDIQDEKKIEDIISLVKPEVINHHAAQMDVRKSVEDPRNDAQINILGFINLIEVGIRNQLRKVIFASSGGTVYGDTEILPTPETTRTQPISPYGISKLTTELYLYYYYKTFNIPYIALRYGNVYGPRQNPHGEAGVVAIFTEKLLKNIQPLINGDGLQTRDFIFVADVIEANVKALSVASPLVVNIGTAQGTTITTLFDKIVSLTHSHIPPKHGVPRSGEQRSSILDISLASLTLNWKPRYSLKDGLQATVDYFKNGK